MRNTKAMLEQAQIIGMLYGLYTNAKRDYPDCESIIRIAKDAWYYASEAFSMQYGAEAWNVTQKASDAHLRGEQLVEATHFTSISELKHHGLAAAA